MKYEIPQMLSQGSGAIVNTASVAGLIGGRGLAAYVASKHGVVGLTKTAALEYAQQGIRVNCVSPGPVATDMLSAERQAQGAAAVPMQRVAEPEEIAEVVLFLASDAASYITGANVPVAGGA